MKSYRTGSGEKDLYFACGIVEVLLGGLFGAILVPLFLLLSLIVTRQETALGPKPRPG
jgi:hypothetical protein